MRVFLSIGVVLFIALGGLIVMNLISPDSLSPVLAQIADRGMIILGVSFAGLAIGLFVRSFSAGKAGD